MSELKYRTDLSVKVGGITFKNPVMPASGTWDCFENNAGLFPMSELGAVMVKSVHRLVRQGNPPPRIAEVTGGMINAVGIPSIGIEAFMTQELPPAGVPAWTGEFLGRPTSRRNGPGAPRSVSGRGRRKFDRAPA